MASDPHRMTFAVRWADLDSNGHMANTAYLDVCVDVRLGYFASRGITPRDLEELGIAPVVRRDQVDYYRELRLGEEYEVDLALAGFSEDGSRFRLRNRFYDTGGTRIAEVASTGGWLDLDARKLVAPPESLREALSSLSRTDDFEELASSVKR